ncbi:SDR family NAD(P)-dependent oxidoreductase [Leptospira sp. GIMC2001]|uniref:SDR family NAD(P)-dependent oxidoreductase n=1 Tax=Leptospira sp. GIMC2001 TaxID=1513297 RepID=UPI00234BA7E7|nr:SDR family oxidoreductase [Leptospira sp. GIMC2001]WCL51241.1 SDR family NAD(P)-dependent oxidoreductase [Leptospira sp. GIMC2001]
MSKTAIITGGNKGIGLGITESFLNAGYSVVVGARKETDLSKLGDRVRFVSMDVQKEEDHRKLVKTALDWTGALDVYVNNAGFSQWKPIEKIDEAFFDNIINTNLKGAFWGCKVAAENLKSGGSILNISSIAGKRGSSNNSMYVASKFGMNGLTQSLAKELGPRGIRVNGLCPVLILTDGLREALMEEYSPAKGEPEKFITDFTKGNSALGRMPSSKEVGDMCVLLSSEMASAITGQNINVDCGVFPQ